MKNLVIVESAAKAKTIQKYLNSIPELKGHGTFTVIASFGHIRDIPAKGMGIDLETWKPEYQPLPGKTQVIDKLRKAIQESDRVYIASDLDLEGEAIANHIKTMFKLNKENRITFNEITKDALKHAVLHPRRIYMNMVNAQEARRILDRVVGYELSPLLWRRFATARLSAGRVQSAALKMIVDKSNEAKKHEPVPYWTFEGKFILPSTNAEIETKAYDGNTVATWEDEKVVRNLLKHFLKVGKKSVWDARFEQKESRKSPSAPFTTSTLQQEAYSRLGLPAKRTMQIAQALYEEGYITYMRTDSNTLSADAKTAITKYVTNKYGPAYVQVRDFKSKAANAQEAHEAIRPTNVEVTAASIQDEKIVGIHKKLYDLIWRRAVASQMVAAVYADVHFSITSTCCQQEFRGKYSVLIEEGFLKVYSPDQKANPSDLKKWASILTQKVVAVKPESFKGQGDVTRPPSLYNEATLVKTLEKDGIGRPSTYATIIDKLFSKGYVIKGSNPQKTVHVNSYNVNLSKGSNGLESNEETILLGGTDMDRFVPSGLGERVVEYLEGISPSLLDREFTSHMEDTLDAISDGRIKKEDVMKKFYKSFHAEVVQAQKEHKKIAAENKKHKKEDNSPKEPLRPKNILREFGRVPIQIVQTRYGPALFHTREERFASIIPFLHWRQKTFEELSEKEAMFLMSLPKRIEGTNRDIVNGRYGLYLKEGDLNIVLKKDLWDSAVNGTLTAKDVKHLVPVVPKKQRFEKK